MTTEPEVLPLSAEEIARITPRNCGARDVERMLATIGAKDAEIAELKAVTPTCICSGAALCAYHDGKFIRPLEGQIDALQSQLRYANRRAFDLNNELGATQNAAQAERVELESRIRERDAEIAKAIDYLLRATSMITPPSTAPSKLVAMAALANQHASDIHHGIHDAVAATAKALTRAEDAEEKMREATELRISQGTELIRQRDEAQSQLAEIEELLEWHDRDEPVSARVRWLVSRLRKADERSGEAIKLAANLLAHLRSVFNFERVLVEQVDRLTAAMESAQKENE